MHSYLHQLPSLIDVMVSAIDEEEHLGTATGTDRGAGGAAPGGGRCPRSGRPPAVHRRERVRRRDRGGYRLPAGSGTERLQSADGTQLRVRPTAVVPAAVAAGGDVGEGDRG
ncbi:putative DNA integrase/recombinase [Streptomyces sp. Tu6071]|nr:putative DNA integrase/recombinase [Streptomyces sp. Tu6071]